VRGRTGVAGFAPDSGGFDLVFGFAFFVEIATSKKANPKHQIPNNTKNQRSKIKMTGQNPKSVVPGFSLVPGTELHDLKKFALQWCLEFSHGDCDAQKNQSSSKETKAHAACGFLT
jgi:hypothetical protein